MIILSHTETFEDCPQKCKGLSYLHDNQEEKTCGICGTKWNRVDNLIITEPNKKPLTDISENCDLCNGLVDK